MLAGRGSRSVGMRAGARRCAGFGLLCSVTACGGLASDGPRSDTRDDRDGAIADADEDVGEPFLGPWSPPPRAVASVRFGALGGTCANAFEYMVPSSDALATLETGEGPRAVGGRDGDIRCRVAVLRDPERRFAVDLLYRENAGGDGELRLQGQLTEGDAAGPIALRMNVPPSEPIEAECRSEVREILSGAIWLRVRDCSRVVYAGELVDCDIELGMIFEYCDE